MDCRGGEGFAPDFLRRLCSYQARPGGGPPPPPPHDHQSSVALLLPEWRNAADSAFPVYDAADAADASLLVSTSVPREFVLGTGASIWTTRLIPAILSAREEVLIATCFWAESRSREALVHALTWLAGQRRQLMASSAGSSSSGSTTATPSPGRPPQAPRPLRIRICFSSRSLLSLARHTASRAGHVYPPDRWVRDLGLPDPAVLAAGGIDLRVKSIFLRPLSVVHSKFVIVDRRRALLPSCNVSWEPWLEGCVDIEGDAVRGLVSFYQRTWEPELPADLAGPDSEPPAVNYYPGDYQGASIGSTVYQSVKRPDVAPPHVTTLVLPHPHHRNPRFRPFPWQPGPLPPATPLNVALLQLFTQARRSIYVQTPNLTSRPAIVALLDAVGRGVDVTVVTCDNVEVEKQLVTAGRTTGYSVRLMARQFRELASSSSSSSSSSPRSSWGKRLLAWLSRAFVGRADDAAGAHAEPDLEAGRAPLGRLRISFFREGGPAAREQNVEDPVRSHLKLTIVDGEYTVLGSGNQDRASWYTSQELGILFIDESLASGIRTAVDRALEGRLQIVLDSAPAP